jgi:hypothetical protein
MSAIAGNRHVNDGFTGKANPEISHTDDFIEYVAPKEGNTTRI